MSFCTSVGGGEHRQRIAMSTRQNITLPFLQRLHARRRNIRSVLNDPAVNHHVTIASFSIRSRRHVRQIDSCLGIICLSMTILIFGLYHAAICRLYF